jgi:hypothetical protein
MSALFERWRLNTIQAPSGENDGLSAPVPGASSTGIRWRPDPSGCTRKDLVAGLGTLFEDAGRHELKGLPEAWRLYAVTGERAAT